MVLIRNRQRLFRLDTKRLAKLVGEVLPALGLGDRDLSVILVADAEIRELNRRFFDKDRPTNVISFSYLSGQPTELAGEIILSVETAASEALHAGIPARERLLTLIAHGILHILGFDHEQGPTESRRMGRHQKRLVTAFLTNPLCEGLVVEPRCATKQTAR